MKKLFILSLLILACAKICTAGVIHVPGDSTAIQAAIDGAVDGDTVLVTDGVYTGNGNRDLDFVGKRIILRSENGPEVTPSGLLLPQRRGLDRTGGRIHDPQCKFVG